ETCGTWRVRFVLGAGPHDGFHPRRDVDPEADTHRAFDERTGSVLRPIRVARLAVDAHETHPIGNRGRGHGSVASCVDRSRGADVAARVEGPLHPRPRPRRSGEPLAVRLAGPPTGRALPRVAATAPPAVGHDEPVRLRR